MHNDMLKTLNDKYDRLVVKTQKLVGEAEICKTKLRKQFKALRKELTHEHQLNN